MGFITLSEGIPDNGTFVISFWFRVPQATLDAASLESREYWKSSPSLDPTSGGFRPARPTLLGVVPLVTFGPQFFFQGLNYTLTTVGTVPEHCHYPNCDGS